MSWGEGEGAVQECHGAGGHAGLPQPFVGSGALQKLTQVMRHFYMAWLRCLGNGPGVRGGTQGTLKEVLVGVVSARVSTSGPAPPLVPAQRPVAPQGPEERWGHPALLRGSCGCPSGHAMDAAGNSHGVPRGNLRSQVSSRASLVACLEGVVVASYSSALVRCLVSRPKPWSPGPLKRGHGAGSLAESIFLKSLRPAVQYCEGMERKIQADSSSRSLIYERH
ncbi:hypothetical protein GWK47_019715 [Chionoecetes opilio]|uniref:Uncharacterized protein n=1 Tax=Chionoecetes opilio TaxID=41210 RepID=A0A8J5CL58_CHIOP|nr:hypothetical protein GWK47_019715 [Chionoecetes opilio]